MLLCIRMVFSYCFIHILAKNTIMFKLILVSPKLSRRAESCQSISNPTLISMPNQYLFANKASLIPIMRSQEDGMYFLDHFDSSIWIFVCSCARLSLIPLILHCTIRECKSMVFPRLTILSVLGHGTLLKLLTNHWSTLFLRINLSPPVLYWISGKNARELQLIIVFCISSFALSQISADFYFEIDFR